MKAKPVSNIAAYIAALILLQTLYFKFSAHPDSVAIFTALGLEPFSRIGIGVAELVTALLLIVPATRGLGGLLGVGIISGAIFAHLTQLGISVNGDGGALFAMAIIVFVASAITAWLHRFEIPVVRNLPFMVKQNRTMA